MWLVYYMLVDNYMYKYVQDTAGTEFELNIVNSHINERLDMSEKLLGVVSARSYDTSMSGMEWEVSGSVLLSWMLPLPYMGVVITLIDCTHQLFTYLNEILVAVGRGG